MTHQNRNKIRKNVAEWKMLILVVFSKLSKQRKLGVKN